MGIETSSAEFQKPLFAREIPGEGYEAGKAELDDAASEW